MHLLVIFLAESELLGEIFQALQQIGIQRATLVESIGLRRVMSEENVPLIASLHHLLRRDEYPNVTLFIVVETEQKAQQAISIVDEIVGGLENPNTGLAFTIPIHNVTGFIPDAERP
ncbi:MAG: hypothetical protein D6723_12590 [Acidobacteria bacterium]|nr:MAG: hypothetical protein D6723_12590 [Acidobacteriota bacterium]